MPEQEWNASSSHHDSQVPVLWWVRLCRLLWKIIAFLGGSVILSLVVNVLSTWLTGSKGMIPADSPFGALMKVWPMTLLVGCCLLLFAALVWAISRWNTPTSEIHLPSAQDRERVLRRLHLYYEQWRSQSLQGAIQMDLGLVERPAAIYNAASLALRLPKQPEQKLPAHTSIVDVYERYAQQELLILGEPGAGKSTLLLELATQLVKQAEQNTMQPLPVLLPLSSWANKRLPLQEWIIEQFAQLYEIPWKLSRQWVQAELVLPLLDGLDEMGETSRPACIAAINTYHREHLGSLVICSRTNDYDQAARQERLVLHTAVVVQPFSPEQVDTYLVTLGKPMAALRTALKTNPTLAELATVPLMLQILILTYCGTSVKLLTRKQTELQQQIWATYVERMVTRKGNTNRYPLEQTCTWLSLVAHQIRDAQWLLGR